MDNLIGELKQIAGEKNLITKDMPQYHAYTFGDATLYRSSPEVIVYPSSEEEIQKIVKLACKYDMPVITGAGLTGLSGGAIANGGILLNMLFLSSIKSIDPVSKTVVAQPGITCARLNERLKEYGMIVPVAP